MSFNFPASPADGTIFAPAGGPVYTATGGIWAAATGVNQLTAEARNRVCNPCMQISQENGTTAVGNGNYPVDQFMLSASPATVTAAKVLLGASGIAVAALSTTLTTAKPSLAAGDLWQLTQYIEGTRIADFRYGLAAAKPAVVRFTAQSTQIGTYTFAVKNHLADRCFLAPFTITVASTWQDFVIAIPGDITGTWLNDTSKAMILTWGLAAGSTYNTGVAGWGTANMVQIAGNTNLAQTANNAFYLTNVGLYLDPNATGKPPPWQTPDEAEELRACMRYWENRGGVATLYSGSVTTGQPYTATGGWLAPKRIAPALTGANTFANAFPAATGTLTNANNQMFYESRTANATSVAAQFNSNMIGNARM